MAKVLIAGANGYIGRRLIASLIDEGHHIVALVRDAGRCRSWGIEPENAHRFEVIQANALDAPSLQKIPNDIDAAYYLIHSMSDTRTFAAMEHQAAKNLAHRIAETQARQIIYLGGISNAQTLSTHLSSRQAVEGALQAGRTPVTVLRAAIIIGSGSASFEIIRDLVEKLPIMITPKWLNTRCQPIAVRDALAYLVGVLLKTPSFGNTYDIGGPDVLTYKEMLLGFARYRKMHRFILPVPLMTPRLSSTWVMLVTSVPYSLARSLVDSLGNEVIVQKHGIEAIVPRTLLSYEQALDYAFGKIQSNNVLSSWNDGADAEAPVFTANSYVPEQGCFKDVQEVDIHDSAEATVERIFKLGGDYGWYGGEWLWEIRGFLDKCVGGVGLRRGRRNPEALESGDVLDFWRVLIADKPNKRLLLFAEMKLPGEAWLEFKCVHENGRDRLIQIATFRPLGLLGRLYWYSVLPFHGWIFPQMARKIAGA